MDFNKTMKIIIHGWMNDRNTAMPRALRTEYEKLEQFNILVVDWSEISQTILYPLPANGTTTVGECVCDMLMQIYNSSFNKEPDIHIIGFSLGAHVAAFAGRKLMQRNFTVNRITGIKRFK